MEVLKARALAQKLDVHESTVWRWSKETDFPKPFQLNGMTVWDVAEVDAWINQKKEMRNGNRSENGDQPANVRPADCAV